MKLFMGSREVIKIGFYLFCLLDVLRKSNVVTSRVFTSKLREKKNSNTPTKNMAFFYLCQKKNWESFPVFKHIKLSTSSHLYITVITIIKIQPSWIVSHLITI
jgi:hypothetical protein